MTLIARSRTSSLLLQGFSKQISSNKSFTHQSLFTAQKHTLVLVRHGESTWNLENKFTGWYDCPLSPKGIQEVTEAGKLLKEANLTFDVAYTSLLKRAIRTLFHVLDATDCLWIPTEKAWQLNERHYGALQGLDKQETVNKYGKDQVHNSCNDFAC